MAQKTIKILSCILLAAALSACGKAALTDPPPVPAASPSPVPARSDAPVRISELMAKNRAVLPDDDGDFTDWIELENYGEADVDLTGWRITDKDSREGMDFPHFVLPAGGRVLVFAGGKDDPVRLQANFSLSQGETVSLYDGEDRLVSAAPCLSAAADTAVAWEDASASYVETLYPSPRYPNGREGYCLWQESLTPAGPLVINEVAVYNTQARDIWLLGDDDWIELCNISAQAVRLSDYYLSDDRDELLRCRLPDQELAPGAVLVLRCAATDDGSGKAPYLPLALDSSQEELYLSDSQGQLIDYASLRDIPYDCSYGRLPEQAGWFYFAEPSPNGENRDGFRWVTETPTALSADGVFNDVRSVRMEVEGAGTLYYSIFGGSLDGQSGEYTEPVTLTDTCCVQVVAQEEGGLPSRPLSLSYILNENHSLPVLSLVTENRSEFNRMYYGMNKQLELGGSLSLYEEDGGFSVPCGVRMHGQTSLVLEKKNMSVHLRGVYGQTHLSYDVYRDGGVSEFSSFVLRAGQDYYSGIVRNALCQNLALNASDTLISERSKFCILYTNGRYAGIYALMEKPNEQLYADLAGVSRDSVTVVAAAAKPGSGVYEDVLMFCKDHDMSDPENYETLCSRLDIDSLIDWILLEGYTANEDLTSGNLRYCRSSENDGKWRLMFYDLDATFGSSVRAFSVFDHVNLQVRQVGSHLIAPLLENPEFVDRLLLRAGELLSGPLSNESAIAELDRLTALVDPEVQRDYQTQGMDRSKWERDIRNLRAYFSDRDWAGICVDSLCQTFQLTEQQRQYYFGSVS